RAVPSQRGRRGRSERTSTSRRPTSGRASLPDPVLELEEVEIRYGSVPAVRGMSFQVERGEVVGLIGPNGAGKSTTLHAIMGAVPTFAGDIRVHGRSVRGHAPERIARTGVALVPEGRRIFGEFSVEENLRLG